MKLPMFGKRFKLRLTAPVSFDGRTLPADTLVDVTREQATTVIMGRRGEIAPERAAGTVHAVPADVTVTWCDEPPRKRKPWRPRNAANRLAPRGSVRLDPGAGIFEQVREIVGR